MIKIIFITFFCFFLFSCDSKRIFEENTKIEGQNWFVEDVKSYNVDIADTNSQMNVFINLRHTSSYSFSNLWVFVNTIDPDGMKKVDTLECILSQPNGKWLGKGGITGIWTKNTYLTTQRFKQSGVYIFEIEQAMRYGDKAKLLNLEGVSDIGLRIETAN